MNDPTAAIHAYLDGELTDAGRRELTLWLDDDPRHVDRFVRECDLHSQLYDLLDERQVQADAMQRGLDTLVPSEAASDQWPVCDDPPSADHRCAAVPGPPPSSNPQSLIPNPSPVPFIVVDDTLPSPLSSLPSFLFSYTVAAIIFGIAGLCGWLYQIEHYTEFARQFGTSPAAVEQQAPAIEKTMPVARVTGLVDCRWSEPDTEAFNGSHISLGRRFALASGLLQLTYDSGANVILQGPCTYEVESGAAGFLALGKLTAKVASGQWPVASKSTINNQQSTINNPSLSTNHYPPFTIKTPTATVTDLGTEFGVAVGRDGRTETSVFAGEVLATVAARPGQPARSARLTVGQTAQIDSAKYAITVLKQPTDEKRFVRAMPCPPARPEVLVDDDTTRPAYRHGWRAGVYSGFGWADGWRLRPGTNASHFIVASGVIDADGKAFATSANRAASAEAVRDFAFDDLPVGAMFMIDLQHGPIGRGSSIGFGLHNARGEYRFQLYATDGRETYGLWDSDGRPQDTGIPYTTQGLHVELTRTGPDDYELKIVQIKSETTHVLSGKFVDVPGGKDIKSFRHWHWDDSGDAEHRSFFNKIRVIVPPKGEVAN